MTHMVAVFHDALD